mmetsp:Transcript_12671/g.39351  ORF Transcript_12671/g.39351 Transcript_12671/m.39351 type:complete len:218 (-) Transcript_12671:271-924(-)
MASLIAAYASSRSASMAPPAEALGRANRDAASTKPAARSESPPDERCRSMLDASRAACCTNAAGTPFSSDIAAWSSAPAARAQPSSVAPSIRTFSAASRFFLLRLAGSAARAAPSAPRAVCSASSVCDTSGVALSGTERASDASASAACCRVAAADAPARLKSRALTSPHRAPADLPSVASAAEVTSSAVRVCGSLCLAPSPPSRRGTSLASSSGGR